MSNSETPKLNIRKAFHLDESPRHNEERLRKKYKRLTYQIDDRFERLSDEMDDHFEDFALVQVKRFERMEARIDALSKIVLEQSKLKSSDKPVPSILKSSGVEEKKEDSIDDKANIPQENFNRMEDRIDDLTMTIYDEIKLNSSDQPIASIEKISDDDETEEDSCYDKVNLPHERPELSEDQSDNLAEKVDKKSDPTERCEEEDDGEEDGDDVADDDDDDEDYIEVVHHPQERLKLTMDQPNDLNEKVGKQSNPISLDGRIESIVNGVNKEEGKGEDSSSELSSLDQSTESKVKVKGSIKRIKNEEDWNNNFEKLRQYTIVNDHCDHTQILKEDPKLGKWAQGQCYGWNHLIGRTKGTKIKPERAIMLDSIGMKWSKKYGPPPSWNDMYEKLGGFLQKEGHCNVPLDDANDPIPLVTWLTFNRTQYKKRQEDKPSLITQEQIELLDVIGFDWEDAKL